MFSVTQHNPGTMISKTIILTISVFANLMCYGSEILNIKLTDGRIMKGRLEVPSPPTTINEIIIFIHGTGPATYLNHRKISGKEFNYFDLFSEEFKKSGIAFFSYNQRGTDTSSMPPFYDTVNRKDYGQYLPSISVDDIESTIKY